MNEYKQTQNALELTEHTSEQGISNYIITSEDGLLNTHFERIIKALEIAARSEEKKELSDFTCGYLTAISGLIAEEGKHSTYAWELYTQIGKPSIKAMKDRGFNEYDIDNIKDLISANKNYKIST